MKQLESYTYTVPAGGSVQIPAPNDNFYVTASTGPLSVRGDTFGRLRGIVAGQGLKGVPFNRLELIDESGAPNTVTILLTPAEFVNQVFSGSVAVVGALALNTATTDRLVRPELPNGSANLVANLVANTAQQVIAPGANVNGVVVLQAGVFAYNSGTTLTAQMLAKSSAPASVGDGDVIVPMNPFYFGGPIGSYGNLCIPQYLAPGQGLWVIGNVASTLHYSSARWRAL